MKGLFFTTLFEHIRERHDDDMVDDVIDDVDLPHGCAYTKVGTYPFDEFVALATAYASRTERPLDEIFDEFGVFCFGHWVKIAPKHFDETKSLFDVLTCIDRFHHNEVKKLYPDAELPSFQPVHRDDNTLELIYRSDKPLANLAAGVIRGAAGHFGEPVDVRWSRAENEEGAVRIRVARV